MTIASAPRSGTLVARLVDAVVDRGPFGLRPAIDSFPGTILLVTHDRMLLQHIRRTRTIELRAGQVVSDQAA